MKVECWLLSGNYFVSAIECYYCPADLVSFSSKWSEWENSTTTGQEITDLNKMLLIKKNSISIAT